MIDLIRFNTIKQMWLKAYIEMKEYYIRQQHPLAPALSYMLERPGKQRRPMACMMVCDTFSPTDARQGYGAAIACELVHIYSLIHDDLPAMDNAETRRGSPALHKALDEAGAILAGDALLSDAFGWITGRHLAEISGYTPKLSSKQQVAMVQVLSELIGSAGMVLGQAYDVKQLPCTPYAEFAQIIEYLPEPVQHYAMVNLLKTGSLFAAALMMGAIAAHPDHQLNSSIVQELKLSGLELGLVYQFNDDLKDLSTNSQAAQSPAAQALRSVSRHKLIVGLNKIKQTAMDRIDDLIKDYFKGPLAQDNSSKEHLDCITRWRSLEQYLLLMVERTDNNEGAHAY